MKRVFSAISFAALGSALILSSSCLAADYTAGIYEAEATGMNPGVKVSVTVDESAITEVVLDVSGETAGIGAAAGEDLTAQIMEAQSAQIDGVSGATLTSEAVKLALTDCLNQASGTESAEKTAIADGTYSGKASGFSYTGMMTCDVTFEGGLISDIKVTEESDSGTGEWFASAENLLIPRIIENQSLETDAITGATISSNGIKACVAAAIDAAGGNSMEWHDPVAKSDEHVVVEDYDVVVVGMGGSGILSYCAAADQGASVFGIEAAGKVGGNSACTYGPMALNSQYLKDLYNNGEDYINADDVYKVWMEYVESDEKADVIEKAVYNSGSALDYYVENFGFEFRGMEPRTGSGLLGSFVVPEWTMEWTVYSADEDNTSWNVLGPNKTFQFLRALDIANEKNEKNTYMTELTATDLIFDENGKAIGVNAAYYDGTTYEIYGKSIILATGGFVGNEEMMNEVYGSTINTYGVTVCKGTGIQMGLSAGGDTYSLATLPMVHISQVANMIRNDDLTPDQKATLSALALTTDKPMITVNGEPWGNTNQSGTVDEGLDVEIVFAPNFMYYNVYTQEDMDNIKVNGLTEAQSAAVSAFMAQGTPYAPGTPVDDLDTILEVGEEYNNVIKAGSIAELAEKMGVEEAVLSETLGNTDTTYYLVACTSYAYGTVGGLNVDVNMNVLREDGTPIENLYAVGQDSEGTCNVDGKAYSPWGGQAQSWTFVSGQLAGTAAGQYALTQAE